MTDADLNKAGKLGGLGKISMTAMIGQFATAHAIVRRRSLKLEGNENGNAKPHIIHSLAKAERRCNSEGSPLLLVDRFHIYHLAIIAATDVVYIAKEITKPKYNKQIHHRAHNRAMILIYSLCACVGAYLAALASFESLKTIRTLFDKTRPATQGTNVTKTGRHRPGNDGHDGPGEVEDAEISKAAVALPEQPETTSPVAYPLQQKKRRVIVAMTGATGAILGIHLLQKLRELGVETHLVISKWADATIKHETDYKLQEVRSLATKSYSSQDVAAPISSGSFKIDAMIVVPCSMKTLSSIATGYGDDLISRAADVTLKERRRLILVARETPLSRIHLENMLSVTQSGAIIFPPVPAFYIRPKSLDDIVSQSVGRMLDLVDIDTGDFQRWTGMHPKSAGEVVKSC